MGGYLIIGNGVAGTTAADNIRTLDREEAITLVTDEDLPFYYRIRLNEYMAGEISEEALVARKPSWYEERRIELRLKTPIAGADPGEKAVVTAGGERLSYGTLLLAMGSHSFVPPIQGAEKTGVFTLRSVQDARDIGAYAARAAKVVLIGGGLLGLEAGNALRKLGKAVTVVEFFPRLLPRQLDPDAARRLQAILEEMGFAFRLGAKTREITGDPAAAGVLLESGERLPADMVVVSAGVRPNLALAEVLGLDRDKGVKVDERMRTSRADIYAAGDVAEFEGTVYGIWPASLEQGKIAGINMAGGEGTYKGTTMANTLKVVGVDLASAGDIDADNALESRVVSAERSYRKIVLKDGRIVGCIMLGNTKGFDKMTRLMSGKKDVSGVKDRILAEDFDLGSL